MKTMNQVRQQRAKVQGGVEELALIKTPRTSSSRMQMPMEVQTGKTLVMNWKMTMRTRQSHRVTTMTTKMTSQHLVPDER